MYCMLLLRYSEAVFMLDFWFRQAIPPGALLFESQPCRRTRRSNISKPGWHDVLVTY